jgi:hypothetical protein
MAKQHRPAKCAIVYVLSIGLAFGAEGTFDGVYTGKWSPTKGPVPPCAAEEDVSVTISGETLTFTHSKLQNFGLGFQPHQ